jgi:alpha-1,3-glucan synthase
MGEFAVFIDGMWLMPYFQWFPVESSSTGHMLSQFTKTIKMALKSTDDERAILRARSAVQRFPVVEWCQRIEYFHGRSILTSRGIAGNSAWRSSDGRTPLVPFSGMEVEYWNTEVTPDMNHRPFGQHSRASPLKSIASIMDGKTDSPLNKVIATVCKEHFSCLRT